MNYIQRSIETRLLQAMKAYKAVLVTGPRQAGKSTLLKQLFPARKYVSLDDPFLEEQANQNGSTFMMLNQPPITIDEAQRAPIPGEPQVAGRGRKKRLVLPIGFPAVPAHEKRIGNACRARQHSGASRLVSTGIARRSFRFALSAYDGTFAGAKRSAPKILVKSSIAVLIPLCSDPSWSGPLFTPIMCALTLSAMCGNFPPFTIWTLSAALWWPQPPAPGLCSIAPTLLRSGQRPGHDQKLAIHPGSLGHHLSAGALRFNRAQARHSRAKTVFSRYWPGLLSHPLAYGRNAGLRRDEWAHL